MTSKPTRVLGYGRVSKIDDEDEDSYSLAAQRTVVAAEASRRGWNMEWLEDPGKSGKNINPALREALQQLASGQADALIVAKMDRLARSVSHAADIMATARAQGWDLIMCDLNIDLSTPQGKAMANVLATFAEFERDMISMRTKEGLAVAKASGKRIGRPALVSATVARRIVTDRTTGASFGAIARALTAEQVPTPAGLVRPWQDSTVRRIYNAVSARAGEAS